MHHEDRAKILFRMADLMDERAEDFAIREAMDMGMPYKDFREIIMPHCSGLFRFFGGLAMSAMNGGYRSSYEHDIRILTRREPLGVVAAITPFNFPLALSCSKIAPALAAGNTIVHKPASDTPLTALALAQVALDAGIPEGVYNLITGPGGSLGDALVKNPKVEKIAFTGSTGVGQGIMRNGADTMKHLTMELGGKSPNIVFADAKIEAALQAAFWGIFWNKAKFASRAAASWWSARSMTSSSSGCRRWRGTPCWATRSIPRRRSARSRRGPNTTRCCVMCRRAGSPRRA